MDPLKATLSLSEMPVPLDPELLPMVTMSRTQGTSIVFGRLTEGQVYAWGLNSTRSQLVSELRLASCAGALACSDDGAWVCCANKETGHVDVFARLAASREPKA